MNQHKVRRHDPHAIRLRLRDEMVSIGARRALINRDVGHREEALAADFAEQAIELENAETLYALDDQLQMEAHEIQAALMRLDQGSYGTCEACGTQIDERRLAALPATRFCVRCANEAEKKS
jgi:RNA polymerase-binding transcription factor DksA